MKPKKLDAFIKHKHKHAILKVIDTVIFVKIGKKPIRLDVI